MTVARQGAEGTAQVSLRVPRLHFKRRTSLLPSHPPIELCSIVRWGGVGGGGTMSTPSRGVSLDDVSTFGCGGWEYQIKRCHCEAPHPRPHDRAPLDRTTHDRAKLDRRGEGRDEAAARPHAIVLSRA